MHTMDREEAVKLMREKVETENLRKHMIAVSQIMKHLARKLGKDDEKWELTGLLHDVDYEETKDDHERHAHRSAEMLEGLVDDEVLHAVKAHNYEHTGVQPDSDLDHALIASDAVSGLVIATALVMPNGQLREARPESVQKKFDDSSFAKNIERDKILHCHKLGIDKSKFLELALDALQEIDYELGL